MSEVAYKFLLFFSTLIAILALTQYLEVILYQKSIDFIKENKHYRPVALVKVMHLFSYTGEVDVWMMVSFFYWGFSKKYSRKYFINLFCINNAYYTFLIFAGKVLFRSGRPYLEHIDLADLELHEITSAEFGNPSGHALSSVANPYFIYLFMT
jgi:hypothetical protein